MKIALLQICSSLDYKENLTKIDKMIKEVKKTSPETKAIILPEVFYSMSDGSCATPYLIEEENEHYQNIKNLSLNNSTAILGGSAATKINGNIYNRSYNFDQFGAELASYDKIHLFKIDLIGHEKKVIIDEGRTYTRGEGVKIFEFDDFQFGLSICFDLRFPELFRSLFHRGANVMLVSSAFTQTTGRAHWETLLKARAIENQSYVIACNQWGKHNDKLTSYGHSMVVDPWGEVIANANDGEKILYAEIDIERVKKIRSRMNMQKQFST